MSQTTATLEPAGSPPPPTTSVPDDAMAQVLRYNRLVEPFLLVALISLMMLGPAALIRSFTPNFEWLHIPVILTFTALEGIFTTNWIRHPKRRILNKPGYRFAEMLLLLVAVRIVTWQVYIPLTRETVRQYLLDPLSILDGAFLVLGLVTVLTWVQAIAYATIFDSMRITEEERDYLESAVASSNRGDVDTVRFDTLTNRPLLLNSFFKQWLNGGLILMVAGGATAWDLTPVAESGVSAVRNVSRLGLQPWLLLAMIGYFVIGLILLSRGRMQIVRMRWLLQNVAINRTIEKHWRRFTWLLVMIIALVAAFLPIGSSVPIAIIVNAGFRLIIVVGTAIVGIIFLIVAFLASLILPNNSEATEQIEQQAQELQPPVAQASEPIAELSETTRLALGAGFWIVIVVIVIAAILFYLRERDVIEWETLRQVWRDFVNGLKQTWRNLRGRARSVQQAVQQRIAAARGESPDANVPPWRYIRVNGLPPRERVRYFYLSTVRRASDRGTPRSKETTPLEFAEELKERWPESEEDVNALTDAFLEARYSARPFDESDVNPIKRTWRRVKSGLRQRGTSRSEEPADDEQETDA